MFASFDALSAGNLSVAIFRHESLTPEQILERLGAHYRAWAVNRLGGAGCPIHSRKRQSRTPVADDVRLARLIMSFVSSARRRHNLQNAASCAHYAFNSSARRRSRSVGYQSQFSTNWRLTPIF